MNIRIIAATVAIGAMCAVGSAGGELQAYERPYTGYGYGASAGYGGAYAAPMPANYARPAGMYYGGYGCGGPCASMPYGYSQGRPGLFGSDVFSAGLLGIGLGYLIFH